MLCTYLVDRQDPVIRDVIWLSYHAIQDHTAVSARMRSDKGIEAYKLIEERINPTAWPCTRRDFALARLSAWSLRN